MHQHGTPIQPEPALHLVAGIWIASCPTCGFPLSTAPPSSAASGEPFTGVARSATRTPPDAQPAAQRPANCDQGSRNYPVGEGARPVVEPMSLAEQIAHLRQLAIADPNTTLLELAIINVLDELAEAVQNLAGNKPRGLGSI